MWHEIEYHYEVLGNCKGDYEKALELFKYELNDFRKICEINTISMTEVRCQNLITEICGRDIILNILVFLEKLIFQLRINLAISLILNGNGI